DKGSITGIDLQANLRTADVAATARQVGYNLPRLGPGRAELHASGDLNNLSLRNVSVRTGDSKNLMLTARGAVSNLDLARDALPEAADFNVTVTLPQLSDISRYMDASLPPLGRTHATGKLRLRGSRLEFSSLKVDIGAADQPVIRLDGKATTVLRKGSSINASFDVAATDLLMAFTDMKPGYLGRLKGSFTASSMGGSWGFEQFQLASAQTRLYQIDIRGGRENFNKTDLANVKTTISIRNPSALGEALNIDLSGISPWSTKGELSTEAETLSYRARGSLGSTTSTIRIDGFLKNGKPNFKGSMDIPVLYLRDLGFGKAPASPGSQPVSSKPDRNYIFSRKPLNVSFLKRVDLDFSVRINQVESHGELSIDSVNSTIRVRDGVLNISPMTLIFEGGKSDLQFKVDANGVPAYSLQITGDDIVLGPLMAQVQDDVPITGYSSIDADLTARGRSPHDIVSSLDGNLSIGLENAKIPTRYVELLSVDVFGWAYSQTKHKESYTDLNCVVVAFDIESGQMNSRTLIADGPNLTTAGHVNLNLAAETMDIVLIPKQKKRLFSSIEPVKIKGSMMDPKVEAVPVKAAIQEVGAIALLPTVVIPVRVLGKLWSLLDEGDEPGQGCASLKAVTKESEKHK
ncbi:MAG TPA: AsmA family protein, partial [Gammaproteobacteria bacterium]|nr:AsmA family protein [Gammaproteobacteria bacterium]